MLGKRFINVVLSGTVSATMRQQFRQASTKLNYPLDSDSDHRAINLRDESLDRADVRRRTPRCITLLLCFATSAPAPRAFSLRGICVTAQPAAVTVIITLNLNTRYILRHAGVARRRAAWRGAARRSAICASFPSRIARRAYFVCRSVHSTYYTNLL